MATRSLTLWLWWLLMLALPVGCSSKEPFVVGANVKVSANAPWGSEAAGRSLGTLADAGATQALLVAFVWQARPDSSDPVLGSDSTPEQVRAGLRQMRQAGLEPVLKVHLWIPGHWAGDADPTDRAAWFRAYQSCVQQLAQVAREEGVQTLVLATELRRLQDQPQWPALVQAIRTQFTGKLLYVADGIDHARSFRYWSLFDAVALSLYPVLPEDTRSREARMQEIAADLAALGRRVDRPVWIAELGLRSARGSLKRPWESPEQRRAQVDLGLQAQVLKRWRYTLEHQPGITGLAIWCWYTDPDAGGRRDSDFTPQNKPAQSVFAREQTR
ncbi:MAG: glycosidase-like protein [Pseudoxanthomonas sp.]